MGISSSRNLPSGSHGGENREDQGGSLLHVSLKIEDAKLCLNPDLIPHVFGSVPLAGSWDPSKALPMERESTTVWQLSFVVPPNHETLDFKFLLKPTHDSGPCIVEEGANHVLVGGKLLGECQLASFKFNKEEFMESKVYTKVDLVSPFDLAASWRAFHENRRPSTVRGMPDVIINSSTQAGNESGSSAIAELDIENYVVPSPAPWEHSGLVYAANLTETPRYFLMLMALTVELIYNNRNIKMITVGKKMICCDIHSIKYPNFNVVLHRDYDFQLISYL